MPFSLLDSFKEQNPTFSILLVDDDQDDIRYLKIIFEKAGFHVVHAHNAQKALKILNTAAPDLILSDLNMPGTDGIEFCRQVYLNDIFLHIPFVFISAIHDDLFKMRASEAGSVEYIHKPFSADDILKKIMDVLNRVQKNNLIQVQFVTKDPLLVLEKQNEMRENGIVASYCDTAKKALENIHTEKYNLIISDLDLNDTSAFEFCKILKKDAFKNIPFIIYSDNVTSNIYSEGIKYGVNDFWNSAYTTRELISKIKSYLRKTGIENGYPKGISGRLDDRTVMEVAEQLMLDKKTGILSLSNTYLKGHIHFTEGSITDASSRDYDGVDAFYTLMTMHRGGFYRFVKTENHMGPISEIPQNLFLYTDKLITEIQKIWDKVIIVNNTFTDKPDGASGLFAKAADGKKTFWQILKELDLDAYHGYLAIEKLIESGKLIAPVREMLLMEFNQV